MIKIERRVNGLPLRETDKIFSYGYKFLETKRPGTGRGPAPGLFTIFGVLPAVSEVTPAIFLIQTAIEFAHPPIVPAIKTRREPGSPRSVPTIKAIFATIEAVFKTVETVFNPVPSA